jgi:iron complex outermembrane receptor protein
VFAVAQNATFVIFPFERYRAGLLALLFVALGGVSPCIAQTIHGTVVNDEGHALAGANVLLLNTSTQQYRYGTTTSADGTFVLGPVQAGRYHVTTSYLGFDPDGREMTIVAGSVYHIHIELAAKTVTHPGVVIAAHRARPQLTPVTFSNLTADELRSRPDMKDLPATLSSRPSTTYYSENGNGIGYSTLRIRGFDQRRIAVSINGIPQNDPEDFNVFWINFFDVDGSVEDIQVQRGAGASVYGSVGIGGAINIVALPYRPNPYAEVTLGYGSYDTKRLSVEVNSGLVRDKYVAFARFSRLESDGYRDWSWTEFNRFFVGLTRYGSRSTVTLQAYGGPQRDGLAFSGIPRAANVDALTGLNGIVVDRRYNSSLFTQDTEDFHQPHIELHHEWQATDKLHVSQSLFWVRGNGYFDFGANFRSADYLRLPGGFVADDQRTLPLFISSPSSDVLFRASLDQWQVGWIPRLTLDSKFGKTTIGGEARLHRSERWGRIQEAIDIPSDLVGSDADRRVYQFRGEKVITSISAGHEARPSSRLAIHAEALVTRVQYRVYEEAFFATRFTKPYVMVNPRIGVTVNPERTWSAYGSIAYSGREPRLKSLYDGEEAGAGFLPRFETDANGRIDVDRPFVDSEHLLDFEVGVGRTDSRSTITVNGYWMEFMDEIVPSGGLDQFGVPRTGNADRTRHIGLESEWRVGLTRYLDVYGNFAVGRARYRRFVEFATLRDFSTVQLDRSDNPIPGFPSTNGNLEFTYRRAGFRIGAFARYVGRQYIDNSGGRDAAGVEDESLTVDPYFVLDASASHTFSPGSPLSGLSIGVDVNNVLNSELLLFGNVGPLGPQFFPSATRHVLFRASYVLR